MDVSLVDFMEEPNLDPRVGAEIFLGNFPTSAAGEDKEELIQEEKDFWEQETKNKNRKREK